MNLVKYEPRSVWDPFTDLWDLRSEMDKVIDSFLGRPGKTEVTSGWQPAVDIYEEKDHYTVKAELPGVTASDIKVSLTDNTLTLSGERKAEHEEKHEGYHRFERSYGEFSRSFRLPSEVKADKIKATHKAGVLEIEIPKSEAAKTKKISIKVE
jgi:HSP20 family protein